MSDASSKSGSSAAAEKKGGFFQYFPQARDELKKVTWPTRKVMWRNTGLVIGVAVGTALFMWLLDQGLERVLRYVI